MTTGSLRIFTMYTNLLATETEPARQRNGIGSIFTVIPSKVLLFETPFARVPVDRCSTDIDGRRRFSAEFYAGILRGLGVVLVLPLDDADYDPAAFLARGIRVCTRADVLLGPETAGAAAAAADAAGAGAAALHAASLQRFSALAQAAGGAVAVHCDRRRLPQVPF